MAVMSKEYHLGYQEGYRDAKDELSNKPIKDLIRQMKSEIADSLEFWDYSPNNNPLARDMLETINTYCAKIDEGE